MRKLEYRSLGSPYLWCIRKTKTATKWRCFGWVLPVRFPLTFRKFRVQCLNAGRAELRKKNAIRHRTCINCIININVHNTARGSLENEAPKPDHCFVIIPSSSVFRKLIYNTPEGPTRPTLARAHTTENARCTDVILTQKKTNKMTDVRTFLLYS